MEENKNAQSSVDWISANDKIAMAKKAEEIIKAFNEGKEIWRDCMHSQAIFKPYRVEYIKDLLSLLSTEPDGLYIKKDPEYRPYKNAKEFLEALKEHGPYYYQTDLKDQHFYMTAQSVTDNGFYTYNDIICTYSEFLQMMTWQDGTKCGLLEASLLG